MRIYMRVLKVTGGLCNRLRFVFSHYVLALERQEEMVVIWPVMNECPGYFEDYFQPVPGITFYRSNTKNYKIACCSGSQVCNPDYSKLQLQPHMIDIINHNRNQLQNNYIAIHVRRTDHSGFAKSKNKFTTDEEFVEFINDNKNKHSGLFVATDNKNSYVYFTSTFNEMNALNDRGNIFKEEVASIWTRIRNTSLKDSIIDLYMCVYANVFKGSGWSSYSETIRLLRKLR